MVTKKEKKVYSDFRKYLIKNGYMMMQFSVYCRIFNNREAAKSHVDMLKKYLPNKGQIRIMIVTESQYKKMEIIVGERNLIESKVDENPFLLL